MGELKSCESCLHIVKRPHEEPCRSCKGCDLWEPRKENVKPDMVNHPSHYTQGGIEAIDGIKAATTGLVGIEAVCTGNAIKYLWRWKSKNGAEDLKKSIWYIRKLLEELGADVD